MQQKKHWKTTHRDTNILAHYQWSVTFNFFLGACSSSHWSQWAFHYQLQWELAQASVIFLLDWQGMQILETQHVELLMGGNDTSAALWLIKKWALNVNPAQLLQGQQPQCPAKARCGLCSGERNPFHWRKNMIQRWQLPKSSQLLKP